MTSRLGTLISKAFYGVERSSSYSIRRQLAVNFTGECQGYVLHKAKDRTDFGQMGTEDINI